MRIIILVGPDTIATRKWKTKAAAQKALKMALRRARCKIDREKKRVTYPDSDVNHKFLGREYSLNEMMYAVVLNYDEYFKVLEKSGC